MKTIAVLVLAIVLVESIIVVAARAQLVEEYHHERIANGQIANPGAFPFVASHRMIDLRTGKFFHLCGATILSQNWLVTLASCIRYVSPNYNQVVVGAHHVRNDGITHSLQAVMRHPNYDYEIKNNIGLLRTKEPIKFTNAVRPIRFSRSKLTATNLPAVTIGWGDVDKNHMVRSDYLRFVQGATISNAECRHIYKDVVPRIHINDQVLCVRHPDKVGVCFADNGGPLIVDGILAGMVLDWPIVNCGRGPPDLYVEFVRLSGWVTQMTGIPGLP